MPLLILITVVLVSFLWIFLYPAWRRKKILAQPFPTAWKNTLLRSIPFFASLDTAEQQQLQGLIQLFIEDKRFHGCGGLQITDEIRITIAAEACLLLLNRSTNIYYKLKHILVYPDAFRTNREQYNHDGTISTHMQGLLGESWQNGKVILSWDDVEKGISNFADGHNVVLHEFAHQLDSESGSTNGAPLMSATSLQIWAQVFSEEFEQLNDDADGHHKNVMDYYGATNPAEFFAVATETFFEKPQPLHNKHPELYTALSNYYRVDPLQWHKPAQHNDQNL